jgi:hypothetical protein
MLLMLEDHAERVERFTATLRGVRMTHPSCTRTTFPAIQGDVPYSDPPVRASTTASTTAIL